MPVLNLPIGADQFGKIIRKKLDVVDKSLFIQEVIDDPSEVILITRPRRFGKTLNLSMLQHFFAKEVGGKSTEDLFDGLQIMQAGEGYLHHHRKYPVIFISFKEVKNDNFK